MKNSGRVGGPHREKVLARGALAFLAAVLLVTLTVSGASMGAFAGPLQASGSPSPSGGGTTAPTIQLLNPSIGYDPALANPPRPVDTSGNFAPDPPKISDKFDGIDSAYHVVAVVTGTPVNPLVEASILFEGENEQTVGTLTPVVGSTDTWEMFWEIPNTMPEGAATFRVRLYEQTATGPVERDVDEEEVDMQHRSGALPDRQQADETVELTWPTQNGQLGFFKPRGGVWRTVVEGTASSREPAPGSTSTSAPAVYIGYSTTAIGKEPDFTLCQSNITVGGLTSDGRRPFALDCALAGNDVPSKVTAIVAIAAETDNPQHGGLQSQDSADVHRVHPYLQTPDQMTLTLVPEVGAANTDGDTSPRARRLEETGCLSYLAQVRDQLDRPVQGASIDVHIDGPNDQLRFGDSDPGSPSPSSGAYKDPEKGHATENADNCDRSPGDDGAFFGTHSEHNVPGGDDIKHRESAGGTGPSGGRAAPVGTWRFHFSAFAPGFTNITAWVDDEDLAKEADQRPAENDTLDPGEPTATARAQWYAEEPTLEFVPLGDTAPAGTCNEFMLKARSGTAPIPGINVDLHAQGPDDGLDFCDVDGGTARHAPDAGDHDGEDGGESNDKVGAPRIQHTEGETNDEGNFIVGVLSPTTGDTTLTAWIDGEAGFDNDLQGAATAEPAATARMSWASSSGEVKVNFLNPSPYGGSSTISKRVDSDATYHIVVRVDAPSLVSGVELQLGTDTGADFKKTKDLGVATQVTGTDTYELRWPVDVGDDDYTLRAQVVGTAVVADQEITVNNTAGEMDPSDVEGEAIELTRPLNDQPTAFSKQSTPVEGIASAGTEGVDVFYTKAPANKVLVEADWIKCGFLQLSGEGSTPQPFKTTCQLTGADQAIQVTAVAAAPFNCAEPVPGAGCDAAEDALPIGRNPGALEAGDAHRVFGYEANPVISLSPPENESNVDACSKLVLHVTDQTGQVLTGQNVDVHMTGPGDAPQFCSPADGSTARRAPDQGGHSAVSGQDNVGSHVAEADDTLHTEGETNGQGRFVFGIRGDQNGDSQITAWVDRTDNDVQDTDEASDSALMHWVDKRTNTCTHVGTAGPDVLTGTAEADKVCGKGGNDVLRGKGGNDVLLGGKGNDRITGGAGDDTINASRGKDRMSGHGGNDSIKGAAGRDRINGGRGVDTCDGGPERDRVRNCERGPRASSSRSSPRLVRGGVA